MIFDRSRTGDPSFSLLQFGDVILLVHDSVKILGTDIDGKLTLKTQISSLCSYLSPKIGILKKSSKNFRNQSILGNCFFFYFFFFLHSSLVQGSAANCYLDLLECISNCIKHLVLDLEIDLQHKRNVTFLCMYYKVVNNPCHPLHSFPPFFFFVASKETRNSDRRNSRVYLEFRFHASQYQHVFFSAMCEALECLA